MHSWWCCESSKGNALELKEKWTSLVLHIANVHEFEDNEIYKRCIHGSLPHDQLKNSKWLIPDSPAHNAMTDIVLHKLLVGIIPYLVDFSHTGNLEVFRNLILKYCPKRLPFPASRNDSSYAVLQFNGAIDAPLAKRKNDDVQRYKLQFSKLSQGYVVKPMKEVVEKTYLNKLVNKVVSLKECGLDNEALLPKLPILPKNIAPAEKPDKEETIARKRFSKITCIVQTYFMKFRFTFCMSK